MAVLSADADEVRASGPDADRARVYALDVLVVAKSCARMDESAVARMARDEGHEMVRSQLLNALAYIRE